MQGSLEFGWQMLKCFHQMTYTIFFSPEKLKAMSSSKNDKRYKKFLRRMEIT